MNVRRALTRVLPVAALVLPVALVAPASAAPVPAPAPLPAPATPAPAAPPVPPTLPRHVDGGAWPTSHLQGAAVDLRRREIYWSFTQQLVRTDLAGRVLGTVEGLTGHLGDLALDPDDGRVYGSLEYKAQQAFYIAIFDPAAIDRVGMDASSDGVMTTVYLPKVVDDFTADMDRDGVFDGDTAATADHRYGASGIDGVAFGPAFGRRGGPTTLKVAYGIYSNVDRVDNDNQVILEYDTSSWRRRYERPLDQAEPHRKGPRRVDGTFFVPTGNTRFGIQNLEYDAASGDWLAAVYPGAKPGRANHSLYVIDGDRHPTWSRVSGQRRPEYGRHLALVTRRVDGSGATTDGWTFDAAYGLVSLGGGLFYRGSSTKVVRDGAPLQTGALDLYRWTGATPTPFERVS